MVTLKQLYDEQKILLRKNIFKNIKEFEKNTGSGIRQILIDQKMFRTGQDLKPIGKLKITINTSMDFEPSNNIEVVHENIS